MKNFVKRGVIGRGVAAALVLALAVPVAYARPPDGRQGREDRQGGQYQQQPSNPREARQQDMQRSNGGEMQRPQRLSPEERRQLRRDIKDAGQEIYAPRR